MGDMTLLQQIRESRIGGRVERCHGVPHLGSYSNAAHQWGVAMLMWYIWPEHFHRLVLHCLSHDVPEGWLGDIPAPTLRFVPGVRGRLEPLEAQINDELGLPAENALSAEDLERLKACDRLELYLWCQDQQDLGNKNVDTTINELEHYFKIKPLPEPARLLFEEMRDIPRERRRGVVRSLVGEDAA